MFIHVYIPVILMPLGPYMQLGNQHQHTGSPRASEVEGPVPPSPFGGCAYATQHRQKRSQPYTDAKFITSAPRNVGRMRDSEEGCPQMLFVGGECEKKEIAIK